MSIQCSVDCLDCRAWGPAVGAGGFLGAPELAVLEECEGAGDEPMPSFGYFYEALSLLGIRRYDLEEFRTFLAKHDGHRLHLSGDHDDNFPAELLAMQEDEELSRRFHAERQEADARREARTAGGEFVMALYEIACVQCGDAYGARESELLRSFERLAIDRQAVELFLERWGSRYPDDGWNHRLCGIVDPYEPFMEGLPAFLKRHVAHQLEARLRGSGSGAP